MESELTLQRKIMCVPFVMVSTRRANPSLWSLFPSTAHLSDEDLGAIIAYVKTVPPVDHETNGQNFSPLAKILAAAGVLG
ncbi:MAG: hypothetical protein M0C28_29895 [Candidatus Moduliflexus flocculans]|nr:hypothetical protein [Candidatus Moduliflexus flocculans]